MAAHAFVSGRGLPSLRFPRRALGWRTTPIDDLHKAIENPFRFRVIAAIRAPIRFGTSAEFAAEFANRRLFVDANQHAQTTFDGLFFCARAAGAQGLPHQFVIDHNIGARGCVYALRPVYTYRPINAGSAANGSSPSGLVRKPRRHNAPRTGARRTRARRAIRR